MPVGRAVGPRGWAAQPVFCPHAFLVVSSCRILAELAMMLWLVVGALLPALLLAAPPPINKLALFPDKSAWCEAKNITQIVGHSGCESKSIQNRYGAALTVELGAAGVPSQAAPKGLWGLLLAQEAGHNALPLPRCLLAVSGGGQISSRLSWEEQAPSLSPLPSCCLCRACLGQCFSYSVPNTFPQSTESLVHCDSCMPAQSMWEIVSIPPAPPSLLPGPAQGLAALLRASCSPSPGFSLVQVPCRASLGWLYPVLSCRAGRGCWKPRGCCDE